MAVVPAPAGPPPFDPLDNPVARAQGERRPGDDRRRRPIGVFDSGVGGLTVLHELLVHLPTEDFLYLGDTLRFPYGDRPAAQVEAFAAEIGDELVARGAKLLVVACNTATAAASPHLRDHFEGELGLPVITVVQPEALAAVQATRTGRIGLLATPGTVASGAYSRAVGAVDPYAALTSVPCPDLAPIIQGDQGWDDAVVDLVRGYVEPLAAARVDTVILGCTHYPLIRPMLQRMLGRDVTLVTAGAAIARRVESALAARELTTDATGEGAYDFLATGDPEEFRRLGTRFLQLPLGRVEQVPLAATRELRVLDDLATVRPGAVR